MRQVDVKLNRWDRAYQDGMKAVELSPSATTHMFFATFLYQLKRYPEVVETVNHALHLDSRRISNATGLTEGVYALILRNGRVGAANSLSRHVQANPNCKASDDS